LQRLFSVVELFCFKPGTVTFILSQNIVLFYFIFILFFKFYVSEGKDVTSIASIDIN